MTTAVEPERVVLAAWERGLQRRSRQLRFDAAISQSPIARYAPHAPSGRQAEFLTLDEREAFYGGAAGGGKSDALLMAALQYVNVLGYAALLLRRTYPMLMKSGALMDRAHLWLDNTEAHWSEKLKRWTFPGGGLIEFGYLENENDKYQYQSAEFQFIGFDEVAQFSESQYRYMFSRLRRIEGSTVPLRMRSASNPDGVGFEWVKARFVEPGTPDVRFVPSRLEDNPGLDREEYERSMENLDPVTRLKLLEGNWAVRAGGTKFRREWFEIVDVAPEVGQRVRYWDLAATEAKKGSDPDYTVGVRMIRSPENIVYIEDVQRMRGTPRSVQALVRQTAELDGRAVAVRMEQEPGAAGVDLIDHYTREVLAGWNFKADRPTGDKYVRMNPLSSYAEAGNVKILRGRWNAEFLDELSGIPDVAHDDQADAAAGAFKSLMQVGEPLDPSYTGNGTGRMELAGLRRKDF